MKLLKKCVLASLVLCVALPAAAIPAFAAENDRTATLAAYSGRSGFSAYVLEDGNVYAMGDNAFAQLGNGKASETAQYYAKKVEYIGDVRKVSAGNFHVLALDGRGDLYVWGNNGSGQLGVREEAIVKNNADVNGYMSERDLSYATGVFIDGVSGFGDIAAGGAFSLALDEEGNVWSFGSNASGQLGAGLGVGKDVFASLPVRVKGVNGAGKLENIAAVRAMESAAVALGKDGEVYAWGSNYYGQLGIGADAGNSALPVRVLKEDGAPLDNIVAVEACDKNAVALGADGKVYVWGDNMFGQKGDGSFDDGTGENGAYRAAEVRFFAERNIDVKQIVCGSGVIFALAADGALYGWGMCVGGSLGMGVYDNFPDEVKIFDQSGNPVTKNQVVFPCRIEIGVNVRIEKIVGSDYRTFVKDTDGRVWSFGNNTYGQAGYSGKEEGVTPASQAKLEFDVKYEDKDFKEPNYLVKPLVGIGVTVVSLTALFVVAAIKKKRFKECEQ